MANGVRRRSNAVGLAVLALVASAVIGVEHAVPADARTSASAPADHDMAAMPGMAAMSAVDDGGSCDGAGTGTAIVSGRPQCFVTMDATMRDQMQDPLESGAAMPSADAAGGAASAAASTGPTCIGDGVSGRRVQVLYMTQNGGTLTAGLQTQLQGYLNGIDDIYSTSAAQTGGTRLVRWVTDAASVGCRASIIPVTIAAPAISSFATMITALQAMGYNRADRKYLIFSTDASFCGIGSVISDSSPGAGNSSNGAVAEYARVDSGQGCWGASFAAHELGHTLGAVQLDAPHTTGGWHCTDEEDVMCYSDAPGVVVTEACPGAEVFDCNHDDYFSTNPPAGSYLATHWNTANSGFLTGAPDAPAAPSNVQITARDQQVTVSWTAPAGTVLSYLVTLTSGVAPTTCSATPPSTSCTINGLTNGVSYSASVVASNPAASPPSAARSIVPPGAFHPDNLTAQLRSQSAFVAWTAPTNDGGGVPTGYTAVAAPGGQSCSVAAPLLSCRIAGLTDGSSSSVTVRALGAGWTSGPSPALNVTPPGAFTAQGVAARVRPGFADVSWVSPVSDGALAPPITSYTVTATPGANGCTATAPATTCRVRGLADGTTYTFRVTPRSADPTQPWIGAPSLPAVATPPGAYVARDVVAFRSGGGIQVSWVPPTDDGGDPAVDFTATTSPGGLACTGTVATPKCTIAGPDPTTTYTVTVVGRMADGLPTAASAPATVAAGPPPQVGGPLPPNGLPAFTAVGPARVFDTRVGSDGLRVVAKAKVGGPGGGDGFELTVQVTDLVGAGGVVLVPGSGVGAVSLNVTATDPEGSGFVTVYPCGVRPLASSLNVVAGVTVPNAVIAPVSAAGTVCFYSSVPVNLLADVNGWFAAGAAFSSVGPARVFDTRVGSDGLRVVAKAKVGGPGGGDGFELTVQVTDLVGAGGVVLVPGSGVGAVSLNVTATDPEGSGFVTVYPCGVRPLASSLNVVAGVTVPNAVIAPVSAAGTVCFYSSVPVNLLADVNGWFAAGAAFSSVGPARVFDTRVGSDGLRVVAKAKVGGPGGGDGFELTVQVTDLVGAGGVVLVPGSGVGAVSLNVTATDPEGSGFVTVYPCGVRPLASSLNVVAGVTVPNAVIAPVSAAGTVCFYSSVPVNLLADVNGWFAG